ncbi:MAG: tetratricopeptide repeat protein, partial [Alphaproteobacteria bacterium]
EALAKNGANVRASYYLGLALLQEGKASEALRIWRTLAGGADAGTRWSADLRKRISRIAKERNIDISKLGPPAGPAAEIGPRKAPPPGPGRADIEAASRMGANERQAMIETMVARLAARLESRPDDFEGWRRLARSYAVLGQNDGARDAYARAAALRPKDLPVLLLHAGAVLEAAGQPKRLPADFIAIMRRVVALDPDNREGLWNLGRAASEAGDGDEAAGLWRRLLEKLPPGSAKRAMVERAIESLAKK